MTFEGHVGKYYAGSRFYDYKNGRFQTQDFNRGGLQAPLTLNRYQFAMNNPVNNVEYMGYFSLGGSLGKVGSAIGGAIVGGSLLGPVGSFIGAAGGYSGGANNYLNQIKNTFVKGFEDLTAFEQNITSRLNMTGSAFLSFNLMNTPLLVTSMEKSGVAAVGDIFKWGGQTLQQYGWQALDIAMPFTDPALELDKALLAVQYSPEGLAANLIAYHRLPTPTIFHGSLMIQNSIMGEIGGGGFTPGPISYVSPGQDYNTLRHEAGHSAQFWRYGGYYMASAWIQDAPDPNYDFECQASQMAGNYYDDYATTCRIKGYPVPSDQK